MDVKTAFRIFRLQGDSSETDLSESYRRLVKRFHPDNNPGKEEWAHSRMIIINNAFELARSSLGTSKATRGTATAGTTSNNHRRREPRVQPVLEIHDIEDHLLDGVYRYYQYGLENTHLRTQGSFRTHYRKALRTVEQAVSSLEERITRARGRNDIRRAVTVLEFAGCFLECMQLDRHFAPNANARHVRAYRKYRNAAELLDAYIRSTLFPELNSSTRPALVGGPGLCEQDLLYVVCHHADSGWTDYAVLKLRLLEVFQAYVIARSP
ncbi:MAG: J domain-containing protein [Spirochaetaceae bacterium]